MSFDSIVRRRTMGCTQQYSARRRERGGGGMEERCSIYHRSIPGECVCSCELVVRGAIFLL